MRRRREEKEEEKITSRDGGHPFTDYFKIFITEVRF